jgi:hypothetical protein
MSTHGEVARIIDAYFDALFNGDVERLRGTFHPRAILSGEVKGAPYHKTVDEYLSAVANRQSPRALGEPYFLMCRPDRRSRCPTRLAAITPMNWFSVACAARAATSSS